MDRFRDHSNAAAIGVVIGLVIASILSWGMFLLALFAII